MFILTIRKWKFREITYLGKEDLVIKIMSQDSNPVLFDFKLYAFPLTPFLFTTFKHSQILQDHFYFMLIYFSFYSSFPPHW